MNRTSYQVAVVAAEVGGGERKEWGAGLVKLEDKLNLWLQEHPQIELVSISHESTATETGVLYSAIVTYREQM